MCKKVAVPVRPQMTKWYMLFACWITKVKHTATVHNTYCFFTASMFARTSFSVTLYEHCLSCSLCMSFWNEIIDVLENISLDGILRAVLSVLFLFNELWNVILYRPAALPHQHEHNWVVNKLWIGIRYWRPVEWTETARNLCATFKIYQPIIMNINKCHFPFIKPACVWLTRYRIFAVINLVSSLCRCIWLPHGTTTFINYIHLRIYQSRKTICMGDRQVKKNKN
jgi:hypothetical protein